MPTSINTLKCSLGDFVVLVVSVFVLLGLVGCSKQEAVDYRGQKYWAHRVNTVDHFQALEKSFDGAELDLVITENCLDIYHPPDQSKGLCLASYIEQMIKEAPELKLWLDVKNLNEQNVSSFIHQLDAIFDDNGLSKDQVLVESTEINVLTQVRDAGYAVSYYLPHLEHFQDKKTVIDNIRNKIENSGIATISTDIVNYKYIENEFPSSPKLLWALGRNLKEEVVEQLEVAEKDSTVQIILITPDF